MRAFTALTALLYHAATIQAGPLPHASLPEPDPSLAESVKVDGQTFINKVSRTSGR